MPAATSAARSRSLPNPWRDKRPVPARRCHSTVVPQRTWPVRVADATRRQAATCAMALARLTIAGFLIAVSACARNEPSGNMTDRLGGWEACFLLDSTTSPFPEGRATCVPFRLSSEQACGGWVAEYVIVRGWPEIDPTWQYDTLRVIYTLRGDTLSFGSVPPGVGSTSCEDEAAAGALFGTGTLRAHGNEWVGFWGLRNEYEGRTLGWFSFLRPGLRPGPGDP